jgi:hypothetical protein
MNYDVVVILLHQQMLQAKKQTNWKEENLFTQMCF